MIVALDSGILGFICHPRAHADVKAWFGRAVAAHTIYLPELADYELRRKLMHIESKGIAVLDELPHAITYLPIDTAMMRDAAALWAELRRRGLAVAGERTLSADVILAAQARAVGATVVTENVKDLARMVPAIRWHDVP